MVLSLLLYSIDLKKQEKKWKWRQRSIIIFQNIANSLFGVKKEVTLVYWNDKINGL